LNHDSVRNNFNDVYVAFANLGFVTQLVTKRIVDNQMADKSFSV